MNNDFSNYTSCRTVAKFGFKRAIGLTYAYTIIFILYAIVRSSSVILNQLHNEKTLLPTLFANGFSIVISSLSIATLVAIFSALLGMFTALVIYWVIKVLSQFDISSINPIVIGFVICLIINLSLQGILFSITGFLWVASSPAAYWFWIGIPSVMHVLEGGRWATRFTVQHHIEQQQI